MPTNNDQVMKNQKKKSQSKTVDEFTSEDWDRYKSGCAVRELRKEKRRIAEAMKKQAAMERRQVQDYMLCPQTEQAQGSFYAGKMVLLRDLRIKARRELGYVPIALLGDGSPDLMKGKDGPLAIPEPWELSGGTGDLPIEKHIASEYAETAWADKHLDGLFALFCVSHIPLRRFYRHEVCPLFKRMEAAISRDSYNDFFEKWYLKLKELAGEIRQKGAHRLREDEGLIRPIGKKGAGRKGRKPDEHIVERDREIARLAHKRWPVRKIADWLSEMRLYRTPRSWNVGDFEWSADKTPALKNRFRVMVYAAKRKYPLVTA